MNSMHTNTVPVTIHIPKPRISFLEDYTRRHHISASQLIDDFLEQLRIAEHYELHPDIREWAGILPAALDARNAYYTHFEDTNP